MALSPLTPRDRLQRVSGLFAKTLRYWWLIAVFAVIGGAVSLAFAALRPRSYQSWATLFYQERIQSSLLQNREQSVQHDIGDRYRELVLARSALAKIVADPKLDPFPDVKDPALAIDKLRTQVRFQSRGAGAFRILYTDHDPARAKAVTAKLTKMLQDKDMKLRDAQAQATVTFATQQKDEAATALRKRVHALAEFLAKHPEFAQDTTQQGEGASIRAINTHKHHATNPRLLALQRQRARIQTRLDAPTDKPIHVVVPPSPERVEAEAAVTEAQRELNAAKRDLADARSKYTERHPAVIRAQEQVAEAQQRLRHAQAAVPPAVETVAPASAADRVKLKHELSTIDDQIAKVRRDTGKDTAAADATTSWVVKLETQYADLRRQVNEQRQRVESLSDAVFRAQIDASTKLAEQGGRLTVVDPAFKPVRPIGPGKKIFLLAGMALFLALGGALALGLAVIDDRLYRRDDLDQLEIAVLGVIPPAPKHAKRAASRADREHEA